MDTAFTFDMGTPHRLRGKKYVCEMCFQQMADLFGYEESAKIAKAEAFLVDERARMVKLRKELDDLSHRMLVEFQKLPTRAVAGSVA